jgi:Bacterial Ig domain
VSLNVGTSTMIDVLANDPQGATLVSVSQAKHGKAVMVNGRIEYAATPGFVGEDTFTYTVRLESGETVTARVTVKVEGEIVSKDLALTGADSRSLFEFALALFALGLALVLVTRRKRTEE